MDQSSSSSGSSSDNPFFFPLSLGQQRYTEILKIKGIPPWTPGINAAKGTKFYHQTSAMAIHTVQLWWPKIPVLTGQAWNKSSRRNQSYLWDMSDTGTIGEIAPQDLKLCQFELWRYFLKCRDKTWAQEPKLSQQGKDTPYPGKSFPV